jgi:transposase
MKTIRQKAYRRQRVIYEVVKKGRSVACAARLHGVSRMSVYRWLERYDGTIESLYENSRKPHSHPRQHTAEEYKLIKKVWSHNKQLGLVCLHMVLEDKHKYMRSVSSLYKAMKRMDIGRKKQRKKRHIPQPYDTPKTAGERVQIDVKYVPTECLVEGIPKLYQYTAVDECTRIRVRYIFDEHTNWNSVRFLHHVRNKMPFDIKCVQTDNGTEFTAALVSPGTITEFEQYCQQEGIHHKRIRVATPRHNGKVERVHRMDSERFYKDRKFYSVEDANKQLHQYQRWDNNFPLLVLGRKSPFQFWRELSA